jgi:hypothetical protein
MLNDKEIGSLSQLHYAIHDVIKGRGIGGTEPCSNELLQVLENIQRTIRSAIANDRPSIPDNAWALWRSGKPIQAIKEYRQFAGCGLLPAKFKFEIEFEPVSVVCTLCGKRVHNDDVLYVTQEGDKSRPYCPKCERLKETGDPEPDPE